MAEAKKFKLNKLKTKRAQWFAVIIAISIYISFYIPVPFFLTMPGTVIELDAIVEVEEGYEEEGTFMLTTVSMMPATLPTYLYSFFNPYMDSIPEELLFSDNEDPEDYSKRQIQIMSQSQENAILAAFEYLNLPLEIKDKGILVMGLIPDMPAEKILEVGDLLTEIDKKLTKKVEDLLVYLENKKAKDIIEITLIRDGKTYTKHTRLVDLPARTDQNGSVSSNKVGIGFYPYDDREIIPSKEVVFNTENIGGPSAGLMFTLEIINQLMANDLTKGYQIAGTGTISLDGTIGQIGGAKLKVKAAYEKGAEIFFVPKDIQEHYTNQKEAEESNKALGSPLQIVPVADLSEAVNFLKQLPAKEKK